MEIVYLGWSSFRISTSDRVKGTTVVIDPFDPEVVGLPWKEQEADIVCLTHNHSDHNFIDGVKGDPYIIQSPGEYEIAGVSVFGIPAFHDKEQGAKLGPMTLFSLKVENFSLVHLGNLGHELNDEQLKGLGEADILMIPVGGKSTIDGKEAAEIVARIEPSIVIPHHFATKGLKLEGFASAAIFFEELGINAPEPLEKLRLKSRNDLPEEREMLVLKHEGN